MRFGSRSFSTFFAAGKRGELRIYDVIGSGGIFGPEGVTAKSVADALKDLEGATELDVFINSPGGDLWEGTAIYTQLERFPAKKTVHVDGLCASMASIIAMVGDRIVTAKNARWMIHEARVFPFQSLSAKDARNLAERLDENNGLMADVYAKRTKCDREKVLGWMSAETWMTASEAKARGFTDEVSGDDAAQATAHAGHPIFACFAHAPDDLRERSAAPPPPPPADPAPPKKESINMNRLALLLGLAETASADDIHAALVKRIETASAGASQLAALRTEHAALLTLTGKTTAAEATGVIQAWKEGAEKVPALTSKLAAIEEKAQADKVEQLIASAKADHRLTPADEPKARDFLKTHGFAAFEAYMGMLHPVVDGSARRPPEDPPAGGTKTPAQVAVFKALGVDPNPPKPAAK